MPEMTYYREPLPWPTGDMPEDEIRAALASHEFGACGPVSDREVFRRAFWGCEGGFDGECRWTWQHGVTPERYGHFFLIAGVIKLAALAVAGAIGVGLWSLAGWAIGK